MEQAIAQCTGLSDLFLLTRSSQDISRRQSLARVSEAQHGAAVVLVTGCVAGADRFKDLKSSSKEKDEEPGTPNPMEPPSALQHGSL